MENIQKASILLITAKDEIKTLLGEEYHMLNLTIETGLTALINRLSFVAGLSTTVTQDTAAMFPPVTNLMGQVIGKAEKVESAQLSAKEEARQQLIQKIDSFLGQLPALETAKILENYVTKEDLNAIRGAAKRVGIADWKTADVNAEFVELIRTAQKSQAEEAAGKKDLEEELTK